MTTKHTPGPWHDMGGAIGVVGADNDLIMVIPLARRPDNKHDLALAVAAPELLDLLKKLAFVAETFAHMKGLEREILPTTDAACELIAKIEGAA